MIVVDFDISELKAQIKSDSGYNILAVLRI